MTYTDIISADGFLDQGLSAADSVPTSPISPATAAASTTIDAVPVAPSQDLMKKIPARIIQDAVGLAIFSCMRSGLWMSGSGGSGILIAWKADGTWSPPSGILLHTAALGFVVGVDIYDCVLVINSVATLEMFTRPRVTLGSDVSLTVGPLIPTGQHYSDDRWRELSHSVLTYLKARGRHQSVQLDGSLVTERGNENERFYNSSVDVLDILAGNVRKSIPEITPLFEVIKAAEGRTDFDAVIMDLLSQQPAPGDAVIETPNMSPVSPKPAFGVPSSDDPDPFGVIALEMAGLEIREAGTKMRPTSNQFEYNPSPSSPLFSRFNRASVDTYLTRSNRGSYMSNRTQATTMTDAGTQTDVAETPDTTLSPNHSDDGKDRSAAAAAAAADMTETLPLSAMEPDEIDYTKVDMSVIRHLSQESLDSTVDSTAVTATATQTVPQLPRIDTSVETTEAVEAAAPAADEMKAVAAPPSPLPGDERDEDADDEDEEDEEEPVVFEVATTTQPARATIMSSQVAQVIQAKGSLVTIPKRVPPPLPVRSPARTSRASKSDYGDLSMISSPLRNSFQSGHSDVVSPAEDAAQPSPTSMRDELSEKLAEMAAEKATHAAHVRNSSSIYTAPESRFSMDSVPEIPPTPQATEPASSIDESDHGPKTPRAEDDFDHHHHHHHHQTVEVKSELKMEANPIDANVIAVA